MKHVVISLIHYNNPDATRECLDSLVRLELDDISIQVIIIDNASERSFLLAKKTLRFPVEIIVNKENKGFSGGHNIGIKYALENNADFVVILNNDTIVDTNLLTELISAASTHESAGIFSPKIYFEKGFEFHKSRYTEKDLGKVIWYAGGRMDWENLIGKHRGVDEVDIGQYNMIQNTELATGCCMLIRRNVIEQIGMFDERYFLYYEDTDFCARAKRSGYTIMYVPDGIVWHKNAGSAGGSGSALQDYFISRNRLLFASKYAPLKTKLALLKESARLMVTGRKWQKKGIQDFYLGKFGRGRYNV